MSALASSSAAQISALADSLPAIVVWSYYLSGPILAVVAIVGLIGLLQARREFYTRLHREAALVATQANADLGKSEAAYVHAWSVVSSLGLDELTIPDDATFLVDELERLSDANRVQSLRDLVWNEYNQIVEVLDAMEQYAIFVIKGLADEDIAYAVFGATFPTHVARLYAMICLQREDEVDMPEHCRAHYHTIQLYIRWRQRAAAEIARMALVKAEQAVAATEPPEPQQLAV